MRYCPTAYTIAIATNAKKPHPVDTLIKSEILLSDISIINEETTIEMMTKKSCYYILKTIHATDYPFLLVIGKYVYICYKNRDLCVTLGPLDCRSPGYAYANLQGKEAAFFQLLEHFHEWHQFSYECHIIPTICSFI